MLRVVRESLRRNLSPEAYQSMRYCYWESSYYLPRLAVSGFSRRVPKIQYFPLTADSGLLSEHIETVNVTAPTQMCRVMSWYGSDKGNGWHNYTTLYNRLFGKQRNDRLRIFELGLGTNNPNLVSSMGVYGRPGASLRGWRQLFPYATIYGADIDRDILFEEDRIKTFYCNQLDSVAIRDLWAQPELRGGMDIIIEDGLHTFEGNVSFMVGSLDQLRPGGTYIVEDISNDTLTRWRSYLAATSTGRFPNHEFALVEIPNPRNQFENNVLIIRKRV
jgi:hypothetical protein